MSRFALPFVPLLGLLPLAGCSEGYSPNTYASTAAQQQAAVERGVIIGVRPVLISANGTVGAATGGAAGGVAGAQISATPVTTAFGAIGGALVGGVAGAAAQQAVSDAKGWEYIVQEDGNKLVSVTQTSKTALPIGQHVLVIAGSQQARIVPDYTVQVAASPAANNTAADPAKTSAAASTVSPATEVQVGPLPPVDDTGEPLQVAPIAAASDPTAPPAPTPTPSATSADTAATPPAPSSTPTASGKPEAANNESSAAVAPSDTSTVTPAQATPTQNTPAQTAPPPVSSSSAATP